VLLVLHTRSYPVDQLLWACHVASALIAIGLVANVANVVAIGTLFHFGQGIPAYTLELLFGGSPSATSVLLHIVPIATGLWALWGQPLPRRILIPAWLLTPITMVAAYYLADPALNVMLVHESFALTAPIFTARWSLWLGNIALSFAFLATGWLVLRWLARRW
jgi:hypothetical protein